MKKRIWCLLLVLAMAVSLAACGGEPAGNGPDRETGNPTETTEQTSQTDPQTSPTSSGDGDEKPDENEDMQIFLPMYDSLLLGWRSQLENYDPDRASRDGWKEPISLMELAMEAQYQGVDALSQTGYALEDISGDGVPELVIGAIYGAYVPSEYTRIYAIYALDGEKPVLVADGYARSAYYRGEGNTLLHTGSSGAAYSAFGSFSLAPDGLSLACQDFWYTWDIDGNYETIGCFHNTTGQMTGDSSELLDWPLDTFWEKQNALFLTAIRMELTPLADGQRRDDPSGTELTWLDYGFAEDLTGHYDDWDEVILTEDEYCVDIYFVGGHIEDFTLLRLAANGEQFDVEAVHEYGPLKEGVPVVVQLTFYGDLPSWGVAFTDMDGVYHQLAINTSGLDGSLVLTEF